MYKVHTIGLDDCQFKGGYWACQQYIKNNYTDECQKLFDIKELSETDNLNSNISFYKRSSEVKSNLKKL